MSTITGSALIEGVADAGRAAREGPRVDHQLHDALRRRVRPARSRDSPSRRRSRAARPRACRVRCRRGRARRPSRRRRSPPRARRDRRTGRRRAAPDRRPRPGARRTRATLRPSPGWASMYAMSCASCSSISRPASLRMRFSAREYTKAEKIDVVMQHHDDVSERPLRPDRERPTQRCSRPPARRGSASPRRVPRGCSRRPSRCGSAGSAGRGRSSCAAG